MQYDDQYKDICTPEEIDMDAKVTDAFFAYVKSFGDLVEYKTLSEAVQLYTDNFSETEPSVMLFDDVPVKEIQFWYGHDNRARGSWPKTLLYYDKECQLAFIEGKFDPFLARDYIHNRQINDPGYYRITYEDEPQVKVNIPWEPVELTEVWTLSPLFIIIFKSACRIGSTKKGGSLWSSPKVLSLFGCCTAS